jgi:hypothetical protein
LIALAVVGVFLAKGLIHELRTPAVEVTYGAGRLDSDTNYTLSPKQGEVIIVDGVKPKRFLFVRYGGAGRYTKVFHPENQFALPAGTLEKMEYETLPLSAKSQEMRRRKQAYPGLVIEEEIVVTEGSGEMEADPTYIFSPPNGRSAILEGLVSVHDDESTSYEEWNVLVLQDGAEMGLSPGIYKDGRYEIVDLTEQEREIEERRREHPDAYVTIED